MADIALAVADKVNTVEPQEQLTGISGEAITAGMMVRFNTSTGRLVRARADNAANGRIYGMATRTVNGAGLAVTAVAEGVMEGFVLDGLDYDDPVYLSSATVGRIADAAGTVAIMVGRVIPGHANLLAGSPDKLLLLDILAGSVGAGGVSGLAVPAAAITDPGALTGTGLAAAVPAAAPAGGTGDAAGGWDTAGNRDLAIVTINGLRTWALEVDTDYEALLVDVAAIRTKLIEVITRLETAGVIVP